MKFNFKRLMAMLLSIVMVLGMMPTMVFAMSLDDSQDAINNGTGDIVLDGDINDNASDPVVIDFAAGGSQSYPTLAEAFAAATTGDEVEIRVAGEYSLSGISGKNITVTGKTEGVVFTNIGAFNMGGASVTFNNVTFTYAENSTYKGLQHSGNLVYNDCTFNGQVFLYGTSETFNNCEFNTTDSNNYNVWTYGAKEVTFNECTFNCAGKSVLIYSEQSDLVNDVTVTDCEFIASASVTGKAAIEMDSSLTAGIELTIDGETTANGFAGGNVSGNSLWNNKKGSEDANNDITVVVNNETVLAPAAPETYVAQVGETKYTDLQEAIIAAAPAGTVEILADVTVDEWVMFSQRLSIGSGQIITLDMDGLTINGNNHTLTVNAIESATNGDRLFHEADNLTIKDLTINYADGVVGGISLKSGELNNVTINGGVGVLPGEGNINITGCTFNTTGSAIYNETDRDNLVVTGNTFNTAAGQYAIYLRGNTTFTNNIIFNGKVNVVNGSPIVIGNDFGTERFKVYNVAEATIENNTINVLVFNDETEVKSTFTGNTLSEEAQAVLDAATAPAFELEGSGTETDPYLINNIEDFVWFRNDVNSGNTYEGKYVKLTDNIDLTGYTEMNVNYQGNNVSASTFRPIGDTASDASFNGTFDGGEHTISNLYISGWDINYCWGKYGSAGLFGTVDNATIKNLTVSGFEIQVEGGDVAAIAGHAKGDCTFENITVTNSKIATYNNGCAGIVAWSEAGSYTFKDIEITDSVVLAGLWGSFDSSIGGVLAQADNNATYLFEDVDVACRLDIYNDVTASYKYYLYRMCGMLIGRSTRFISGTNEVDADNITCKNVNITIGEWANYTYIWDNTLSYGCKRVEAGYTYDGINVEDYPNSEITMQPMTSIIGGDQYGYSGSTAEELAAQGFDEGQLKVTDLALAARSRIAQVGGEYFTTLQDAIDKANGAEVTLLADTAEEIAIANGANVVINLGGKTLNGCFIPFNANLTISNGTIDNDNGSYSAIEINEGTLNITDVNVTSTRHGVRIDGTVTATINGGTYKVDAISGTRHAINVSGAANVTIKDGTFVGPKGTTMDSGSAVCVQTGAKATITGGNFSGGKNATLGVSGTMSVTGGTFDQDPTAYVAAGYKAVENNGTWTVKENIVLSGSGTATDPYIISNLEELKAFRDYVNEGNTYADKYIKLTADIDLSDEIWIPIGTSNYDKTPTTDGVKMFAGNFDGGNHTITGLTSEGYVPDSAETDSTEYSFGLFGYVYGANISNVNLADVAIDCGTRTDSEGNDVYGSGVAALIGYYFPANEKATVIENCHVLSGTVKATNNMGGLIGHMDSQLSQPAVDITIENCSNAADVTTEKREAGGILGLMNSARKGNYLVTMRGMVTFKNCVNTGNITSLGGGAPSAGGILGRDHNQAAGQRLKIVFDSCENSGTITVTANGETHAAGIGAGYYSTGAWLIAKDCENTGNVVVNNPSSKVYAGGLISYGGVVELINSTSTGTVTGGTANNTYVGGVQNILFLEKMDNFTDTVNGYTYYLNGGTSPEYAELVDDAAYGGNFHLVETAYKEGAEFGGWYDNAELTGEAYTALNSSVKTYYAKWIGDEPVAKIGDTTYISLQEAIDNANDGDVITVLTDINLADNDINTLAGKYNTYFLVEGKIVTVNLNGKEIYGEYTGDSMLVGVFSTNNGGHLTLTGNGTVDVTATTTVYGLLVNYTSGCSITVENGTYTLDKASDSLIYTGGNEDVIINGGTFTLGNVGIGSNGSPWIFNAGGQNSSHVMVYGGTFNANVFNQYYRHEVQCDGESSITDNGNGTWTVARDAEAYVIEKEGAYGYEVGYNTFDAALAAINEDIAIGLGLLEDTEIDEPIVIKKDFTIEGNNNILNYAGTNRAIDVPDTATGADVTIKNLTVVAGSAERGINYNTNGTLTVDNVTVTGGSYAINFPSSADNATVSIKDSNLTALIALNVWGSDMAITVTDSELYSVDDSNQFDYSTIQLNRDENGNIADGTTVTVIGGKLSAVNEKNEPNIVVSNWTATGDVDISDTTEVIGEVEYAVAMCGGACFYTLQDAIDEVVKHNYNAPIVLIRDIELTEGVTVPAGANIAIDLNGKTITYNSTTQGEAMITNKGTLTINDSVGTGVINYNYTGEADPSYGKGNYTISNAGTLTVNGGKITIANLRQHAKYPIDNNSTTGDAVLVINGGHLYNYNTSAIRQFCNSTTNQNSVTINGGLIEGYCAIWVQNPGSNTVNGSLSITGGEIRTTAAAYVNGTAELKDVSSDIYFSISGEGGAWSEASAVTITGGTFNENVYLAEEAPASITVNQENATFNGRVELPAAEETYVAQIGTVGYETLADAIAAVQPNDTIVLVANVTEDVTISKNLIIDGANFNYTGNISIKNGSAKVTVKNVNFVNGTGYAITTNTINSITVENCSVINYGYGFLYANKSTPTVVVKNVTVDGGNYGFHWVYGTAATLENVTMTNVKNGLYIQNYAGKSINLKDCNICSINIWERTGSSGVQTFKFEGANTVSALSASQYAKYILGAADATLTAPEGFTVTTTVENSMVKYAEGTYKVVAAVAKIGDTAYETLEDAIEAAQNDDTIVLLADIALDATVKVDKSITLDIGGKTITGTDNTTASFALIEVQPGAELTIKDEVGTGKITLTATNNRGWNAYSSVISNQRGKLTVNGGTIEHLGGTDMAYGIDNLTNGKGTYAETVVNGGTIKSTYRAIRQFLNGVEAQNILTVNGGTIEGMNKSIWMQDPSANANSGTLTVGENATLIGDVYLFVTAGSTEWPVEVSIAAAALNGESTVMTGNVPAGYVVENANGTWGVKVEEPAELFNFLGTSTSLDSSLALNIYLASSNLTGEDYYAVVKHVKATGEVVETVIPYGDWVTSGSNKCIRYTGIAAKEMADLLTVTVYDAENTQVSIAFETSLRDYALSVMNRYVGEGNTDSLWLPALTDMLNYGAAAQVMFNYNTNDLANAGAEDFQKYASTDYSLSSEGISIEGNIFGTTLTLEDMIKLNVYLTNATEGMYATYSYTTHGGIKINKTVTYDAFISGYGYLGIAVDDIAIADTDALVTVTVYDQSGNVVGKAVYSVNMYLKDMIDSVQYDELYPALAKFAASAKKAFAKKF